MNEQQFDFASVKARLADNPSDDDANFNDLFDALQEIKRLAADAACEKAEKESLRLEVARLRRVIETCPLVDKEAEIARLREQVATLESVYSYECSQVERLTRARDNTLKNMDQWKHEANTLRSETNRLRTIISNVYGMLFDGADTRRIRAYLQREANTAPDSPQEPPK